MTDHPDINAPRQGDGKTEVAIGIERGRVLMIFPKAIQWIGLDPENAIGIAGNMAKCAYEVKMNTPADDVALSQIFGEIRKEVTREHRKTLVNRVILMMRSMEEQKRPPLYRAEAIVDQILSAVK